MTQHAALSAGCKAWRSLPCSRSELRLDLTLGCGQTFRWRETADGHWTGVMRGKVWTLTQTENMLWYHVYSRQMSPEADDWHCKGKEIKFLKKSNKETNLKQEEAESCTVMSGRDNKDEELLKDYFQLGVKLGDLYSDWSTADPHFKQTSTVFTGVRMLRQDPTECLFSFICSSNNHISRIQGMIDRLCQTLGMPLCKLDGVAYHDFPPLHALADGKVETVLRDLGFGYRAGFLQQCAQIIVNSHSPDWLSSLRGTSYPEAREALRALPGVGLKVADCVCLMSLDKSEAIPVDTHVWQIAKRDYSCSAGSSKTLTDKAYKNIGDFFRELWGPYAGWAHSVLFCADLKRFQKLKEDIPALKDQKKERLHQKVDKDNEILQNKKTKKHKRT